MQCEDLKESLVDYADGVLPAAEARHVAAHLSACPACRARADTLRRSLELATALWRDNSEPIAAGGAASEVATTTAGRRRHMRLALRLFVPLAAAAAVLLALLPHFYPARGPAPSPAGRTSPGPDLKSPPGGADADEEPAAAELVRATERAGLAAGMLAAADMLAEQPAGRARACERYRYIATEYADSPAALAASERYARLCAGG